MSRYERVAAALRSGGTAGSLLGGFCATAAALLQVDAAGLAVLAGLRSGNVCTHGAMADVGEDLQFTLGEGPCRDAFAGNGLVEATQLATDPRWQMFAAGMVESGCRSVASFPVRIGGARIGAMTIYRTTDGALSSGQAADGYVLARVAAHLIVAMQAEVEGDGLMEEIEAGFVRMEPVHQATGMIMGQLGKSAEEALLRLRGASFAAGRPIVDVACDVIEGRVVLSDDTNL